MREIAKFKKQYKLEQDQINAPESVVEQLHQTIQTSPPTYEETAVDPISQDMSTPTPAETIATPKRVPPLLVASLCTCAVIGSSILVINNFPTPEYTEHPSNNPPDIVIDTDGTDTYDVFSPDDETDDYGTDETDDSGQTSPDSDDGRLQIIIRPSP